MIYASCDVPCHHRFLCLWQAGSLWEGRFYGVHVEVYACACRSQGGPESCVGLVLADSPNQLQNPLQHLHAAPYGGFPGSFQGAPQPQPQHPMQQAPQPPQPQPQRSADPVIDPTRAGRAPSGPIGASLESRGSSSSNLAAQVYTTSLSFPEPEGRLLVVLACP